MARPLHLVVLANGQGYHMPKWLSALVEAGVQVTLFSYHPPREAIPGVTSLPLEPLVPGRPNWLDFWRNTRFVHEQFVACQADVLMASYATSYGWLAVRSGVHPLLLQTWTLDISHYPTTNWRRWILRPLVRRVLNRADAITTDGSALAEYLLEHYPMCAPKVVSMRWGIRLADYDGGEADGQSFRQAWSIPPKAPLVVSTRGLQQWYRPEVVLPALEQVLAQHASVHVIVLTVNHAGTPAVQQMLDRLALHPRVHVVDRLLRTTEMRGLWAAADIMVSIPSDDGVSESILEAMYAGVLPVVSEMPSNRSFLDDEHAFFVQGDDADELAETIGYVVGKMGPFKADRVPRNKSWVAEEASVEGTACQMRELIERLASGQKP